MKIATWNCNGALRKKMQLADKLCADILVIQECENPEFSTQEYRHWAEPYLWAGKSRHKGLGIFARNGHSLKLLEWHGEYEMPGCQIKNAATHWTTNDLELFVPCQINDKLTLLGVWTKQAKSPTFSYIGQLWKYLQIHRSELIHAKTVICGDFNSNAIWDKADRWWNHSDVVAELKRINLHSLYHHIHNEPQGDESHSTYFMYRDIEKSYHIDYAFVSGDLLEKCTLTVGSPEEWLNASDHMPVCLEIASG